MCPTRLHSLTNCITAGEPPACLETVALRRLAEGGPSWICRLISGKSSGVDKSEPESETSGICDDSDFHILQQMLADLQDQSWLIRQDQLCVCIHNDAERSDVRLGRGSFGSVRWVLLPIQLGLLSRKL